MEEIKYRFAMRPDLVQEILTDAMLEQDHWRDICTGHQSSFLILKDGVYGATGKGARDVIRETQRRLDTFDVPQKTRAAVDALVETIFRKHAETDDTKLEDLPAISLPMFA